MHAPPRSRPQAGQYRHPRRFRAVHLVAAAAVLVALAGAIFGLAARGPRPAGPDHKLTALQRQEAANRAKAATWIVGQVSPGAAISCDPQMCDALKAARYPAKYLLVLSRTSPPPLTASLVVETATVRGQFGTSLQTAIAPAAIDTIGTGEAAVSVRLVAPDGLAAFQKALAAGQQARKQNEAPLVSAGIATSAAARADLAHGAVDMRLALAISTLASSSRLPIDVVEFGNVGTGVSGDLPLSYADLAQPAQATHMTSTAYMAALTRALRQISGYRPLWARAVPFRSGATVLRVEMGAPGPLGWSSGTGQR